jgi:hypothetical protein
MIFIRWTLIALVTFIAAFTLADYVVEPAMPWSTQLYAQYIVIGGSLVAGILCWIVTRFEPTDDRYDE